MKKRKTRGMRRAKVVKATASETKVMKDKDVKRLKARIGKVGHNKSEERQDDG